MSSNAMRRKASGDEYRILADTLRDIRLKANITQVELAERLGLSQSFVSKCDRGAARLDIVQVRRLCLALGVKFPEFVRRFETALRRNK
jgi:transcriptional regulator with XRE-family HTH domain